MPKIQIEIAAGVDQVESITEAIAYTTRIDSIGDGKVFVLNVEEALRIGTGETGTGALKRLALQKRNNHVCIL